MRLGLVLRRHREKELATAAEAHGLFGVYCGLEDPMTAITAATYASTPTEFVRIVVAVRLGLEHPVTIAEELAVLDNVNNGRTIVACDVSDLDADTASDEISVLREALASRPIQHEGPRWKVPAGIPANATAPKSISVTPKPAQAEVPFWVAGTAASEVGRRLRLPVVTQEPRSNPDSLLIQPGIASVDADVNAGRKLVHDWAVAGTTHLFLELSGEDAGATLAVVSRYLAPEAAMPHFPRVMSESRVPLPWPGEDGKGV